MNLTIIVLLTTPIQILGSGISDPPSPSRIQTGHDERRWGKGYHLEEVRTPERKGGMGGLIAGNQRKITGGKGG